MSRNKSYNSRNRKYTSRENHLAKKQKKIKAYTLANIEDEPSEQKNTQVSAEIEAPDSQQTADVVTSHVGETATENEQEPAMELSHNDAENANQQPSSTGSEDTQERPAELEQNESSIEELPTTTHESVQPEDSRNKPHEEAEEPTVEELPTTRIESVRPETASSSNNKPEPEEEQEETTGPDEPPIEELPTTRHESVRAEKKPDGSPAAAKEQIAPDRANGEAAAHQNGKPRSARRQTLVPVNDSARAGVDIRQAGTALERAPGKNSRLLVPVKTTADSERRFSTHDQEISRRTRVNRLLMRRRRHLRLSRELAPRVTLALAIVLIVLTTLFSGSAGAAYAYYQAQMPLLDGIAQHSLFQTTRIYDRNGKLLYELYNKQEGQGRRTYVNYNDISPLLIQATVAAEDRTFWENSGVDPYGIVRALFSNLQNGGIVEGASTITQQLIKKQLFDNQPRTFQLKGEEALLATGLTQKYPKWKIMEMYLNTIFYGDLNYGAEAAAEDFFNLKPKCNANGHCTPAVKKLTLAQASLLAGLPQSPTVYNPLVNKQAALDRQATVLQAMVELKYITPQQKEEAQKETAKMVFKPYATTHPIQAPHFVWYIIQNVLEPMLGAENLATGGYNIYTTLDLDLEKKVEQITHDALYTPQLDREQGFYGVLSRDKNVNNAAVVVMDPRTGELLAMNGSADYHKNTPLIRGQDNAALALRQPGSSFKPFVYATAFEMGWYPAMIVPDHKTVYPGVPKPYEPRNYDGKFHTNVPMTIRTAVGNSFNIPAIDALMYAGNQNVLNLATRLGLTEVAKRNEIGASLALGSAEVSLLDLTSAYATFANNGVRAPTSSILRITDNQGRSLYQLDRNHPAGQQVMRPDVAFLINSILSDKNARYLEFSRGNVLELPDRPAAAKTGTTDSFRDNWTMGYTPNLTVGVWAGNSDNEEMNNVIGITGAGPIWNSVMEYAAQHYHLPAVDFARPGNVHQGTVSAITGLAARPGEPTTTDWFIDGTLPTISGSNGFFFCDPGRNRKNNRCDNTGGDNGGILGGDNGNTNGDSGNTSGNSGDTNNTN